MIKKMKIILLIMLGFLVVGCQTDYTLTINQFLEVEEIITTSVQNETIISKGQTKEEFLTELISNIKNKPDALDYEIDPFYHDDESGLNIKRLYLTTNNYQENSPLKGHLFSVFNIIQAENNINIAAKAQQPTVLLADNITIGKINIKTDYIIHSHNADYVDNEKNIYTWFLDEKENEKLIEITISTTQKYKPNFFNIPKLDELIPNINSGVLTIIIIIVGLGVIIMWLIGEHQKNNQI
jgi:uncharacterized protein YcfL